MIELRHINYFVVASEQGSFRKAATLLSIQESAVSRRIRDLEDQLGASLFQRHSGGVCLTQAGQRFLRRARIVLQQIEDGVNDVAAIGCAAVAVLAGRVSVDANRRAVRAASSSCARRCSSGLGPAGAEAVPPGVGTDGPPFCALRIGRPRSPGSGGPSLGTPV